MIFPQRPVLFQVTMALCRPCTKNLEKLYVLWVCFSDLCSTCCLRTHLQRRGLRLWFWEHNMMLRLVKQSIRIWDSLIPRLAARIRITPSVPSLFCIIYVFLYCFNHRNENVFLLTTSFPFCVLPSFTRDMLDLLVSLFEMSVDVIKHRLTDRCSFGWCVSPAWWRCGVHRLPAPSCCSWSVELRRAGGRWWWSPCSSGCQSPFLHRHLRYEQTDMRRGFRQVMNRAVSSCRTRYHEWCVTLCTSDFDWLQGWCVLASTSSAWTITFGSPEGRHRN